MRRGDQFHAAIGLLLCTSVGPVVPKVCADVLISLVLCGVVAPANLFHD